MKMAAPIITILIFLAGCPRVASPFGEGVLFPDTGKRVLVFDEVTLRDRCRFDDQIFDIFDVIGDDGTPFVLGHRVQEDFQLFALADEFKIGVFLNNFESGISRCANPEELDFNGSSLETLPISIETASARCGVELDLMSSENIHYLFSDGNLVCGTYVAIGTEYEANRSAVQPALDFPSAFREIGEIPCMPIDQWKTIRDQKELGLCTGDF